MSSQQPGWQPDPTGRHEPGHGDARTALFVILGVIAVVAVGSAAFVLTREDDEEPDRQEYVDAIAASMAEDEGMLDLDDAEFECLAAAQVDIYGVGTLSEAASADEMREHPERRPSDWGIETTDDAAHAYFDSLIGCVDDLGAAFAQFVTSDLPTVDPETAGDCLAGTIETPEVEDAIVDSFVAGNREQELSEDSATVLFDWLDGCIDFHTAFLEAIAAETGQGAADCISETLTEDVLREAMVSNFTGDEEAQAEFESELMPALEDCGVRG